MQKLRIIHVINVRWFNATAWYAITLASLQQKAGHTVLVLVIKDTDTDTKAKELGLTCSYINLNTKNPFTFISSFLYLRSLLSYFSPDTVNCHRGESFILWSFMKLFFPFSLIRTRGDQRLPKKNIPNTLLHKYAADAIISTNSKMTAVLEKTFSLPPSTVHTIRGGVDREHFIYSQVGRDTIRKKYGFTEKDYVFGILGRFDWVKGQKEVIQAIGEIYKENPESNLKLLLIGFTAGIKQEQIEEWIEEANITDKVFITGKCDDIPAHISALDMGLLSSLGSETIARAGLEILSCKKPLLSTNVGVMEDLLPHELLIHLPVQQSNTALVNIFKKALLYATNNTTLEQKLLSSGMHAIEDLNYESFLNKSDSIYQALYQKKISKSSSK